MSIIGSTSNTLIQELFTAEGVSFGDGTGTVDLNGTTGSITASGDIIVGNSITSGNDIEATDRVIGDSLRGHLVRTEDVRIWKGDKEAQLTFSETSNELKCSRNLRCTIKNRNNDDEDVSIDDMFFRIQDNESDIAANRSDIQKLQGDISDLTDEDNVEFDVVDGLTLVTGGAALAIAIYAANKAEQIEKVTLPAGDKATLASANSYTDSKVNPVKQTADDNKEKLTDISYDSAYKTTFVANDLSVGDILLEGGNAKLTVSDGDIELNGQNGKVKAKNFSVETSTAMEMVNDGIRVTVSDIETDDVGTKRIRVEDDITVVGGNINCNAENSRLKVARLASSQLVNPAITCESTFVAQEITGGSLVMNEITAVQDVGVPNSGNLTAQGSANIHGNLTVHGNDLFMAATNATLNTNEIIFGTLREHTISELLATVTSLSERVTLLEAATDFDEVDFFFDQF